MSSMYLRKESGLLVQIDRNKEGSTVSFQLTSSVANDNLDVTRHTKLFTSQALMLARSNKSRITSKT